MLIMTLLLARPPRLNGAPCEKCGLARTLRVPPAQLNCGGGVQDPDFQRDDGIGSERA
jgi:hypothetical protein